MMIYDLVIDFAFSHDDDQMSISIDGTVIAAINGKASYRSEISLPSKLWIKVQGKNEDKDTLMSGNTVIRDRFVKLINVSVNGIQPNVNYIKRWPILHVGGRGRNQLIYSHYWGFNGDVELDFEGDNVSKWLMATNKFRDDSWHKNHD